MWHDENYSMRTNWETCLDDKFSSCRRYCVSALICRPQVNHYEYMRWLNNNSSPPYSLDFCIQTIWVCILCRKKQELLSKTGQWINKPASPNAYSHFPPSYGNMQTTLLNPHDDKRPKLERARSAAEKENHPLQRTDSRLRRQYSQQETSTQRRESISASDSGVDDSYMQQRSHFHSQQQQQGSSSVDGQYSNQQYRNTSNSSYYQPQSGSGSSFQPEDDPRYYQVNF